MVKQQLLSLLLLNNFKATALKNAEKLCGEKSLRGFSFSFFLIKKIKRKKGKATMALP
jgi:hypothetical protein